MRGLVSAHLWDRPEPFFRIERVLGQEEQHHTKTLVGAAPHFRVKAQGAWRPPLPLRLFIGTLAHVPRGMFHPVLLGAELAGVFTFNWTLQRIDEIYRDAPEVRDAMEARLIEILVDEIAHVTFNRLAVCRAGLAAGRELGALVARGSAEMTPELGRLGLRTAVAEDYARFDYASLPDEVRRRAFFA